MRRSIVCVLLISLLLVSGCVGSWTKTTFVTNMKGKATRTDTVDLALSPGDNLVLLSDHEDVEVRSARRASQVRAEITVVAYTQEEAEQALSAFRVITRRTSRGLEVEVGGDAGTYETESGTRVPYSAFPVFAVTVPGNVKVLAVSESGEVEVKGN